MIEGKRCFNEINCIHLYYNLRCFIACWFGNDLRTFWSKTCQPEIILILFLIGIENNCEVNEYINRKVLFKIVQSKLVGIRKII